MVVERNICDVAGISLYDDQLVLAGEVPVDIPDRGSKEQEGATQPSRASQRYAMRVIHEDGRGVVLVYETGFTSSANGPRTLVFEWANASAELAQYPAEWRKLGDEELLALRGGVERRTHD